MKHNPPIVIGIAPDSFKGSLTALQAATCIECGLKNVLQNISVRKIPMADGGDGTMDAMVQATGGRIVRCTVQDPLGRKIKSRFGLSGDGKTAIVEMAEASGLSLLKPEERNPLRTSTYGTGQLIKKALDRGARNIMVGIGGSATNDGGTGMARALGVRFLDSAGRMIEEQGGGTLCSIEKIDVSGLDERIAETVIDVACDVDNPLCGPKGAAQIYGPQKGATPTMVGQLDAGLGQMARIIKKDLGLSVATVPGAGAAGGLGAGLMAFVGGKLRPGVDIVIDSIRLAERLKGCALVITGEGRMDGQTVFGKAPTGVARVARELGIPVIAIAGSLGKGAHAVLSAGIDVYFSALQESMDESLLAVRGPEMLTDCAEQVARLILLQFRGKAALRTHKKG